MISGCAKKLSMVYGDQLQPFIVYGDQQKPLLSMLIRKPLLYGGQQKPLLSMVISCSRYCLWWSACWGFLSLKKWCAATALLSSSVFSPGAVFLFTSCHGSVFRLAGRPLLRSRCWAGLGHTLSVTHTPPLSHTFSLGQTLLDSHALTLYYRLCSCWGRYSRVEPVLQSLERQPTSIVIKRVDQCFNNTDSDAVPHTHTHTHTYI